MFIEINNYTYLVVSGIFIIFILFLKKICNELIFQDLFQLDWSFFLRIDKNTNIIECEHN